MVSAATNIMDERKRMIKDVASGYRSNKFFEHTVNDILKVLDFKIGAASRNMRVSSQSPTADYPDFKQLDSDSEDNDQTHKSPSP